MRQHLTAKQQKFVTEYLVDLNATKACIRAGYKPKNADKIGSQLVGNTRVAAAINAAKSKREARTEITQDRVLKELARIAFFDIRKLFNPDGSIKPIHELDDDTAAALAAMEAIDMNGGVIIKKAKATDKAAALTLVMRHLGMLNDKLKVTVDVEELSDDQLETEIALLEQQKAT